MYGQLNGYTVQDFGVGTATLAAPGIVPSVWNDQRGGQDIWNLLTFLFFGEKENFPFKEESVQLLH